MHVTNRPKLTWTVRVVTGADTTAVCEIMALDREGRDVLLKSWEWPSGAPTPAQLRDLSTFVMMDLESSIVALCGVQGVLLR
jgi:hypothetical protein